VAAPACVSLLSTSVSMNLNPSNNQFSGSILILRVVACLVYGTGKALGVGGIKMQVFCSSKQKDLSIRPLHDDPFLGSQ
jgi:hypothetical protein